MFDVLATRIDPAVLDPPRIRTFLTRVGPWDPERVAVLLDAFFVHHPKDTHVQLVLDTLHTQLTETQS